jgi:hypothetical protein
MSDDIRHKITEALDGQKPDDKPPAHNYAPGATPEELREAGQAKPPHNQQVRDREDLQVTIGRADQDCGPPVGRPGRPNPKSILRGAREGCEARAAPACAPPMERLDAA